LTKIRLKVFFFLKNLDPIFLSEALFCLFSLNSGKDMAIRGKYRINQPKTSIFKKIKDAVGKKFSRANDSDSANDTGSERSSTISTGTSGTMSIRSSTSSVTPIKVKLYSLELALDMTR